MSPTISQTHTTICPNSSSQQGPGSLSQHLPCFPGHSPHHSMGLHGAQAIIHCDQVTVILITGSDIKASEGEAQHRVGIPPQDPMAAGMGWVGTVRKARGSEACHRPTTGMQSKTATVCRRDKTEGRREPCRPSSSPNTSQITASSGQYKEEGFGGEGTKMRCLSISTI